MSHIRDVCVYCCTEDKKGGVDRSSTVIAKEPEGKPCISRAEKRVSRLRVSTPRHSLCIHIYIYITYLRIDLHIYIYIRIYFHVCRCPPVQTLASPILPIAGFMPFSIEARSLDFKKKSKAMIFPSPPLKSIIHPIIGIVVGKMISNFRISRLIEKINPAPLEIPSRLIKSTCIKFWKIKKRKRKMSGRGRTRRRELILVNLSSSILHSRGEHREGEQGKPMPLGAQWRASSFCTPVCSSFR